MFAFNLSILILSFCFILSQEETKNRRDIDPGMSMSRYLIESPTLYKNEICSYHGHPIVEANSIICECFPTYVNEPRKEEYKYIGDQIVQCSYQKKKRFKTFFLAGIFPMGFDYYYLGHKHYFALIFIAAIIVIVNNCVHFYLYYKLEDRSDDNRLNHNEKKQNIDRNNINIWSKANKEMNQRDKLRKCLKIYNIINKVSLALFAIYWLVDLILQWRGIIKDVNGIETDNDMSILFSRKGV